MTNENKTNKWKVASIVLLIALFGVMAFQQYKASETYTLPNGDKINKQALTSLIGAFKDMNASNVHICDLDKSKTCYNVNIGK